jgi:hypothetical protein
MRVLGTGLRYPSGELLHASLDEEEFAQRVVQCLEKNSQSVRTGRRETAQSRAFRGEREAKAPTNPTDPRSAGWTFMVHRDDPDRAGIIDIVHPLAVRRNMKDPGVPLLFHADVDWARWMTDNYAGITLDERPQYVMIVGGPDRIPFRFQSLLGVAACTGRVSFDHLCDLGRYVEKILRLEQAATAMTGARTLFVGPDAGARVDGSYDATYFSRRYMVEPLATHVKEKKEYEAEALVGAQATKAALLDRVRALCPAVLYTASHGVGAIDQPLDVQRRVNGAISCQRTGTEQSMDDYLFAAEDVPATTPFLEGAVVFQFACFGFGTPASSDFARWNLGIPERNADADFVAALPKALLAHARGPVAFIGHLDRAWVHGFEDPDDPIVAGQWNPRLVPFRSAVDVLLRLHPVGLAMRDFTMRYDFMNAELANVLESKERGEYKSLPESLRRLSSDFIVRGDAQNYLVFGDPAVRVRVADEV